VTGSSGNVRGPLLKALRERGDAAVGTHLTARPADGHGRLLDFLLPSIFAAALEGGRCRLSGAPASHHRGAPGRWSTGARWVGALCRSDRPLHPIVSRLRHSGFRTNARHSGV